ncbi:hypothetical protein BD410DRAFT_806253 [Rickenella mellea]|uniref:Ricin B lectin domain-containing protein n=1 Tax=Rickenella mellea TaxID=50990 RepID=A0A4Y7PWD7_9AGAM|nr:hypothetical protein BD410DRAFT_806253 [Rickenella mellea]
MFSKCLVALLCLNAFAVSTTPAPQVSSRSLTSGLFAIVPTLGGPSLTSFNVTDGSPVGTILEAKTALNQSWSFIATNSPNVFLIMNTASSLFLSFSNAPINGPVQFSQAATHKTPLPFLLQPIPGSKSFKLHSSQQLTIFIKRLAKSGELDGQSRYIRDCRCRRLSFGWWTELDIDSSRRIPLRGQPVNNAVRATIAIYLGWLDRLEGRHAGFGSAFETNRLREVPL